MTSDLSSALQVCIDADVLYKSTYTLLYLLWLFNLRWCMLKAGHGPTLVLTILCFPFRAWADRHRWTHRCNWSPYPHNCYCRRG